MPRITTAAAMGMLLAAGCGPSRPPAPLPPPTPGFTLTSPAFTEGAAVPAECTCDGKDQPPTLSWSGEPKGTKSYALILHDPDAPSGDFTHWVVTDLPASTHSLAVGAGAGVEGDNDFGRTGYGGPCPPPGAAHHYVFELYALDVAALGVPAGSGRAAVEGALKGHVLGRARLTGTYARR
jgi:Raf kinase inhibitor-like YbhB/YbcL family protein